LRAAQLPDITIETPKYRANDEFGWLDNYTNHASKHAPELCTTEKSGATKANGSLQADTRLVAPKQRPMTQSRLFAWRKSNEGIGLLAERQPQGRLFPGNSFFGLPQPVQGFKPN
jgi:hypothetical protein